MATSQSINRQYGTRTLLRAGIDGDTEYLDALAGIIRVDFGQHASCVLAMCAGGIHERQYDRLALVHTQQ